MLYALGVDVGKERHHATCLDERGTRCFAMDVPASAAGMASLTDRISVTCGSSDILLIGMEATGHYYENLFAYLSEHYEDEDAALVLLTH